MQLFFFPLFSFDFHFSYFLPHQRHFYTANRHHVVALGLICDLWPPVAKKKLSRSSFSVSTAMRKIFAELALNPPSTIHGRRFDGWRLFPLWSRSAPHLLHQSTPARCTASLASCPSASFSSSHFLLCIHFLSIHSRPFRRQWKKKNLFPPHIYKSDVLQEWEGTIGRIPCHLLPWIRHIGRLSSFSSFFPPDSLSSLKNLETTCLGITGGREWNQCRAATISRPNQLQFSFVPIVQYWVLRLAVSLVVCETDEVEEEEELVLLWLSKFSKLHLTWVNATIRP